MGKLNQIDTKNYRFGKYDDDPTTQKVKKKKKKKEDMLIALAISKALSQGQHSSGPL